MPVLAVQYHIYWHTRARVCYINRTAGAWNLGAQMNPCCAVIWFIGWRSAICPVAPSCLLYYIRPEYIAVTFKKVCAERLDIQWTGFLKVKFVQKPITNACMPALKCACPNTIKIPFQLGWIWPRCFNHQGWHTETCTHTPPTKLSLCFSVFERTQSHYKA